MRNKSLSIFKNYSRRRQTAAALRAAPLRLFRIKAAKGFAKRFNEDVAAI